MCKTFNIYYTYINALFSDDKVKQKKTEDTAASDRSGS